MGGGFSAGLPFQQHPNNLASLGMPQGFAPNFQQVQQQQQQQLQQQQQPQQFQQSQQFQQGLQGMTSQDILRNFILTSQNPNLLLERALHGSSAPGALNMLVQQQQQQGSPSMDNNMAMLLALQGSTMQPQFQPQFQAPVPQVLEQPTAARRPQVLQNHRVDNSGTRRILLYVPSDDESISPYQCFARQNIELFEAQETDVQTGAQGRNKPVQLGQVGIRCIHCSDLHPKLRTRAAVYYPSRLSVLYQAAQNIVNIHLPELCESIPDDIRAKLVSLDNKRSSVGGGKNYWSDTAQIQGIVDTDHGLSFQDQTSAETEPPEEA